MRWSELQHRHSEVLVFTRPWRRLFRRTLFMRCWECDWCIPVDDRPARPLG